MDLRRGSIVGSDRTWVNGSAQTGARAFVALVCAASAGIHAALVPEHYQEGGIRLGGAFALSALLLGVSAVLVARSTMTVLPFVVLLGTALAYLLSRTTGIPLLIDEPEEPDVLGLVTAVAEVVAAAVAVLAPHNREENR